MNLSTEQRAYPQPARKFLFDCSFNDDIAEAELETAKAQEPPKPTFTQEQVETVRAGAYESGYAEGQKSMANDQRQLLNVTLSKLSKQLEQITKTSAEGWQRQMAQTQEVAIAIARKLMPEYAARNGIEEIQAIISSVMAQVAREPRLVVRVGEAQFDAVNEKIKEISERQAYAGKVIVLAEDKMGVSDCRIEWADGGVERDMAALWQEIDRLIGAGIPVQNPTSGEQP